MKIKFIFSKKFTPGLFETNLISYKITEDDLKDPENAVLTYTFNDLPLTRKFLKLYPKYKSIQNEEKNKITHQFNYYFAPNKDLLLSARKEMNQIIIELIKFGYNIDDSLFLEVTEDENLKESELSKLNSLHFFFETESTNLSSSEYVLKDKERIFYLLEKINNLVHFIETTHPDNNKDNKSFEISIRSCSHANNYFYELADYDYKDFTFPTGGDLVADYSTVGKDLFACYSSNDLRLIERNEVKQQKYLTDYFHLIFNNIKLSPKGRLFTKKYYYDWCKNNNVDKYLNYKLPEYNAARHILGSIDDITLANYENFMTEIISKTPYLLGYILINDDGTFL